MYTRRNLLRAAALMAPLATPAFAKGWHVIHGLRPHRIAASRDEAIAKYLWLIDFMEFTPAALDHFKRVIPRERGQRVEITDQKYRFMAFYKDGQRDVERDVSLVSAKREFAERWIYSPTGEAVDLPETCENFARPFFEAKAPAAHHCFHFKVGFDGKPLTGFFWFDELEGKSDEDKISFWRRLQADNCFLLCDQYKACAKPIPGCSCNPGDIFNAFPAGLPLERHHAADLVLQIPAGEARDFSFPLWAAPHFATYCPEDHGMQGTVDQQITEASIAKGIWDYPAVIEPDSN